MAEYKGEPVARVKVHGHFTFAGYVLTDEEGGFNVERIAFEIADAIVYHAPHLGNSEAGDALVVLEHGGAPEGAVDVEITVTEKQTGSFSAREVERYVEETEAWTG